MKTKIILSAGVLFSNMFIASAIAANEEPLPLKVKTDKPSEDKYPYPLKPVQIPCVYWDGHILSFDSSLEGCTVRLLDSDGIKCFSVLITEEMTGIAPPSDLSGEYELQIISGNFIFYCYIQL